MIIDLKTASYLAAVASALEAGKTFPESQMSATCPECRGDLNRFTNGDHIVMKDPRWEASDHEVIVVVACEGYWVIDPNLVGVMSDTWMSQDDHFAEEFPQVGSADTPAGSAPDGLGSDVVITKDEIGEALERYTSLPPLPCGHKRYGEADRCTDMPCDNYVGKSPEWMGSDYRS